MRLMGLLYVRRCIVRSDNLTVATYVCAIERQKTNDKAYCNEIKKMNIIQGTEYRKYQHCITV